MEMWLACLFLLAVTGSGCQCNSTTAKSPPEFAAAYRTRGLLRLPYAEIEEPFEAFYDSAKGRSRIDYYDGLCQTFQHARSNGSQQDFGTDYKVVYMTTEKVLNQRTLVIRNGTENAPARLQPIVPNLGNFVYAGDEDHAGIPCSKWHYEKNNGKKRSKYTMWISKDGAPVHYEMMGYDSLLESHYDKYEIDYYNFTAGPVDAELLVPPKEMPSVVIDDEVTGRLDPHNPFKELIEQHDDHLNASFEDYKSEHQKEYADEKEHETRKNVYRHNVRYINSFNRRNEGYRLKANHLADYSEEELARLRGLRSAAGSKHADDDCLSHENERDRQKKLPESIDWRLRGAVTPVKDQATCGSCWAFAATGTVEGSYFLKTGQLLQLSEQALIDCTWGFSNYGCDGGEDWGVFEWMLLHGGIPTSDSYGSYLGQDGRCHADNATKVANVSGYVNVTCGDVHALKAAVVKHGPVAVSMDASLKDFSFYANGVYRNRKCKRKRTELDHAVLVVGYGKLGGEPYWIIKNSWSTYWGNDGYVLMSQKNNLCGVATNALYVVLE